MNHQLLPTLPRWGGLLTKGALVLPALAALLAGCVTGGSKATAPSHSLDSSLTFTNYGLPGLHSLQYTISPNWVITEVDEDSDRRWLKKRTLSRRITVKGWQTFQEQAARLELLKWRPSYSPPEIIYDGGGWELHYSVGNQRVSSAGGNAGPAVSDPRKTTLAFPSALPSRDLLLEKALAQLWKESR